MLKINCQLRKLTLKKMMSSLLTEMVNLSLQTQITRCKKKTLNDLMAGVALETASLH